MPDRIEALKLRVEEYFARQMGMTVPEWRKAQEQEVRRQWFDRLRAKFWDFG